MIRLASPPPIRWTLRRRLAALLLVSIGAMSLLGWLLVQESGQQARARAIQANTASAASVAITVDDFLTSTRSLLQAQALLP